MTKSKKKSTGLSSRQSVNLEELNQAQKEAVTHEGGPLLLIAGAGTGKTTVITQRILWLIQERGIRPDDILALTFTEKAASEMEERVDRLLPMGLSQVRIATFHGFCERLLRDYAIEIGLDPSFKILTGPEQWLILKRHLFELPLRYFRPLSNPTKFLQSIVRAIGAAKDQDLAPESFIAYADKVAEEVELERDEKKKAAMEEEALKWREFGAVYRSYQQIILKESAMDFGDIILNAVHLLSERPSITEKLRENLSEVLVDEFQDTNGAQNSLLRMLVPEPDGPITVVGDDDQSVYAWRGSNIANILTFQQWYPDAKKIVLTQNYRSPQNLLDAAYKLIQFNNPLRLEKTANVDKRLVGNSKASEETIVSHHQFINLEQECAFIAETIERGVKELNRQYGDFAILLRTNSQSDLILPALNSREIPFHVSEARGLLLRPEVRDVIAYLKTVFNPEDAVSLFRVLSLNIFGIEPYERQKLLSESRQENETLISFIKSISGREGFSEQTKSVIEKIIEQLNAHVARATTASPSRIVLEFLHNSGYLNLAKERVEKFPEVLPNLSEFVQFILQYEKSDPQSSLMSFLDYLELVISSGESPAQAALGHDFDAVRVMTVHGAKGLEFPVVFLFGATADKYPVRDRSHTLEIPEYFSTQKGIDDRDAHILEERRLFYVAITRAKQRLYITSAELSGTGKTRKKPSKFIEEAGIVTAQSGVDTPIEQLKLPIPEHVSQKVRMPLFLPKTLSASQIDCYETCPYRYQFQYIYRVPVPQHHSLTFGITVHAVFRELGRLTSSGKKATIDDAQNFYEKFWNSEGFESQRHELDQKEKGKMLLEAYLVAHPIILNTAPVYFEEDFRLRVDDVVVNGRIDRVDKIDGMVLVTDFKTGSARDQKYANDDLQLSIYALAMNEVFKMHADRLMLSYLDGPVDRHTTRTPEKLEKTKDRILGTMKGIKEQNFKAKPGPMVCQFCPFSTICDFSAT